MNSVILVCKNLSFHLAQAQQKLASSIPVIELDTSLHKEPEKMREQILEEIEKIPPEYDTILVGMGFCGGSWKDVNVSRRIVIPRMDDCITMLLTTTDLPKSNLKTSGCMYLTDNRDDEMTIPGIRSHLIEQYGEKRGKKVFDVYFSAYDRVSIIDTGIYDSYDEDFLAYAQESADMIGGSVDHVPGSNRVLEKLLGGEWDEQFLVLEPGETVTEEDFF